MVEARRHEDEDDLLAALRCYNRAWRVGYRGMVPEETIDAELRDDEEAGLAVLEDAASPQPAELFVAERDGDVVGYLLGRYTSTSEHVAQTDAEIVELYVDPAYWREGVASALHERFEGWLPDQTEGVVVEVLGENDRAQAFFEALGYEFLDTDVTELAGNVHGVGRYRLDVTGQR